MSPEGKGVSPGSRGLRRGHRRQDNPGPVPLAVRWPLTASWRPRGRPWAAVGSEVDGGGRGGRSTKSADHSF